jgi:hypothetical protein
MALENASAQHLDGYLFCTDKTAERQGREKSQPWEAHRQKSEGEKQADSRAENVTFV